MTIWLNGELVEKGVTDATGAGLTVGWGVFTTLAVVDGIPMFARRHIERLKRDAASTSIHFNVTSNDVAAGIEAIIQSNAIQTGLVRLTLTQRGDGRWNPTVGADLSIQGIATTAQSAELRVQLSPYRVEANRPLVGVKTTSYLSYFWAWREAKSKGFQEAILRDGSEFLSEAARSNLFWIQNGELFTPSLETGCLRGIGRDLILEWARAHNIPIHEGQYLLESALYAQEAYLVSAAAGPRLISSWHDESGQLLNLKETKTELLPELQIWWRKNGLA